MVPRLRHRVGLETLRRELQLVDVSTASPSSSLSVKDSWKGSFLFDPEGGRDFAFTNTQSTIGVGDKIPGFRTSAGTPTAQSAESVVVSNVSRLLNCF